MLGLSEETVQALCMLVAQVCFWLTAAQASVLQCCMHACAEPAEPQRERRLEAHGDNLRWLLDAHHPSSALTSAAQVLGDLLQSSKLSEVWALAGAVWAGSTSNSSESWQETLTVRLHCAEI